MTSSWCNQMCMNGKISQGPLNDINVWCNRSFKTKLYPIIVVQYSHLKWTEVLIEVLKYPNLELYSWCSHKDHSYTRGGLMPLKNQPPPSDDFCEILASTYVWSSTINNLKELCKSNMLLGHFKCTLLQEHVCYALGAVCFSNMVLEHI